MSEKGYWVIRTWEAGQVGEKIKYWVQGERPGKNVRRMQSELKKQEQNGKEAVRRLARLLNENYKKGDLLVGLDYGEAGIEKLQERARKMTGGKREQEPEAWMDAIWAAAEAEVVNFIRRLKRACKTEEIRYIAVTSDMDGETGLPVRIHHHIVLSAGAEEACKRKWTMGGVDIKQLSGQPDYTPLAQYLLQQVRRVPDAKKYKPSKNLRRPKPKDRIALNGGELRLPKNAAMLYRGTTIPGRPQYIRYILPQWAENKSTRYTQAGAHARSETESEGT